MNTIVIHKYTLALLVFICASLNICGQNSNNLYGQWNLIVIENDTEKIEIPKNKLHLTISKDNLKYNLDINTCWTNYKVNASKIKYDNAACTEICCDDLYGELINYSGEFKIENQKLEIVNSLGTFKLIKKE